MLAPNTTIRPPIETVDWETLASVMGVPQGNREHFIWWLITDVENEWRRAAEPPEPAGSRNRRWAKINADLTRTARAFIRAIEQKNTLSTEGTDLPDWMMINSIGQYLRHVKAPLRGAPKRADKFAEFLEYLLYVTLALGGRVLFNRKTGRGNIVELLDELRQVMPVGFIRRVLPLSLIERITAKAHRLGHGIASDPTTAKVARTLATHGSG